jgi:hypothetical protein
MQVVIISWVYSNIKLSIALRKNQHNFNVFSYKKAKVRKTIETAFLQLSGQFMLHINYSKKIFLGLTIRLPSKITAFTTIQYINFFGENRSLNKINLN